MIKGDTTYSFNDYPVCPWCDHKHSDYYSEDGREEEMSCESCEKPFSIVPDYSVDYSTFANCVNIGEKHLLHKGSFESSAYTCQKCGTSYYEYNFPGQRYAKLEEGSFEIMERKENLEWLK